MYCKQQTPVVYANSHDLFDAIRRAFSNSRHIDFWGTYRVPEDQLVNDSERVRMTIHDIWTVTGYRFT